MRFGGGGCPGRARTSAAACGPRPARARGDGTDAALRAVRAGAVGVRGRAASLFFVVAFSARGPTRAAPRGAAPRRRHAGRGRTAPRRCRAAARPGLPHRPRAAPVDGRPGRPCGAPLVSVERRAAAAAGAAATDGGRARAARRARGRRAGPLATPS
ncbi:hypothetical protein BU14_0051s0041 [Porphyra umbilicalis]|uniref:Uncharacterized protein n=1 Tax=Porphyra umbilicalis TaxID=2786 RepID=A0A1X6PI29_PORUM|nr:hypothetical protein BU14_0051s0041 [Porphyra umbilicalis]|eukprot:OSX80521.1 hypothetical protein BU14_0051s0041 [Porphyra umbilicalis]